MTEDFENEEHGFCPLCDSAPAASVWVAIDEALNKLVGQRVAAIVDMLLVGCGITSHSIARITIGSTGTIESFFPGQISSGDDLRVGSHGGSFACSEGCSYRVRVRFDSIEECYLNALTSRDEQVGNFDETAAAWDRRSASVTVSPKCITIIPNEPDHDPRL